MSVERIKTRAFAMDLAHATILGLPMTPTNGSPSIKLADACPSSECRRDTTTDRIFARKTRLALATVAVIADGAGQAIHQIDGSHMRQCAVASL